MTTSAYNEIKELITSGELPFGAPVSQMDLSRRLSVSRTPVREALRRLQAEGLVEAERNKRMRVTRVTPEEMDAIYAMRVLAESLGVALSTPRITSADLDALREFADKISRDYEDLDPDARDRQILAFKLQAIRHAGSGVSNEVSQLFSRCERIRKVYLTVSPGARLVAHEQRVALIDAMAERDVGRAIFVASRHLARTALAVLGYMAPDFEPRALRTALALAASNSLYAAPDEPLMSVVGGGGAPSTGRAAARKSARSKGDIG